MSQILPARLNQVRRTLRDLGARVIFVSEDVSNTSFDLDLYEAAILDRAELPDHIATATDACIWVLAHARQRLSILGLRSDRSGRLLDNLIAASFADWICMERFQVDTLPAIVRQFNDCRESLLEIFGKFEVNNLSALLKAGATRDFLVSALELISPYSVHELAEAAGLPAPNRTPAPTPAIVKFFHPVNRPIQYWTSPTIGGLVAFVVYFSPACTYRVCLGCALPDLSSQARIRPFDMIEQTDYTFRKAFSEKEMSDVRTLVISNNGSVLDEPTFPQSVLLHAVQVAAARMPALERLSFETRAEFVTREKLESLKTAVELADRPKLKLELSLGVEVFDLELRNKRVRKGLSNRAIAELVKLLAETGIGLRCYMMLKSVPGMTDEDAIADLEQARLFFEDLSKTHPVEITLHVNPTYAAVGTVLETELRNGNFTPPDLTRMVEHLRKIRLGNVRMHFGLNDEGLAAEGGSFINPANAEAIQILQSFNAKGHF